MMNNISLSPHNTLGGAIWLTVNNGNLVRLFQSQLLMWLMTQKVTTVVVFT